MSKEQKRVGLLAMRCCMKIKFWDKNGSGKNKPMLRGGMSFPREAPPKLYPNDKPPGGSRPRKTTPR